MRAKHIAWILQELPELVRQGVLNHESATQLQQHYAQEKSRQGSTALLLFGVLGAVLVGVGIILVLAYNWKELSRGMRSFLSLALLLSAQGICAWSLLRHKSSAAWREGSAIFLSLAIGACMALIGQTYHLPSDLPGFLLSWSLLALPLVYLLEADLPAVLYCVGLLSWYGTLTTKASDSPDLAFWALFLLPLPWLIIKWKQQSSGVLFLAQALSITASIGFVVSLADSLLLDHGFQMLAIIFACVYLSWRYLLPETKQWLDLSLSGLGFTGLLILSFCGTTTAFWEAVEREWNRHQEFSAFAKYPLEYALGGLLLAAWLGFWFLLWRRQDKVALLIGGMPLAIMLGQWLALHEAYFWALLGMNLLLLALGVVLVSTGVQENQQGQISFGLLLIAVLIFIRFVDADLPLLARGIAFIVVGSVFLAANFGIARYLKKHTKEASHV